MQTYLLPANNLYGNCPVEITIPDSWEMTVCSFAGEHAPSLTFEEIAAKINTPSGVPPIHEQAKGCRDAVIILDDITRATPIGSIARAVIHELEKAGMPRNKIRFLAAVGTHRAMYREDFVRKLDEELVSEFPTYSHNPFFNNVYLGKTSYGIPIELNADAVAADFKIAIGSIAPHGAVGLAGGAKTILPGIASIETIRRSHLLQRGRWNKEAPGRQNALEATRIFKLNMKIDVLLNGKGEIAQIFAGDPGQIIDDNYEEIKAFYKTPKAPPADLVIANNYFKPTETSVAIYGNGMFQNVKDVGTLVVSSHTPQGSAPHYIFGSWGEHGLSGLMYDNDDPVPKHIRRYFAFSTYPDKGYGRAWHCSGPKMRWVQHWHEILEELGDGPLSVAIYPYATVGYFGEDGNG